MREALRILQSEGLVEAFPNRGARVPLLDLAEVDIYYRMRERLEPLTLVESLRHLTDEQVGADGAASRSEIEANTDVGRFLVLDRDFHMTTYPACASEQLLAMTVRLWNSTQHYRRAFMLLVGAQDRAAVVNAEHRLLLDAVRRRDADDAERFLDRAHPAHAGGAHPAPGAVRRQGLTAAASSSPSAATVGTRPWRTTFSSTTSPGVVMTP